MIKGTPELIADRRETIINACEQLYATMPFREITLKEIGALVPFSRPTIYNYFQTKEEIFLALFTREYDRWNADLDALLQSESALSKPQLAGKIAAPGLVKNLIKQSTIGAVDETIRRNAEAREEMGLDVSIVRTYSDVGLRAGTKYSEDCEWCLERCGEWDNYKDAKDAGCFERHPGCLCMIDYHVGKTHSVSSGGGWVNI